jgi:hypothetical protein
MISSCVRRAGALLMVAVIAAAAVNSKPEGTAREYWHRTFGKTPVLASASGAGIEQARGVPREWGGGMAGFGKRLGSVFGTHLVKTSLRFAIGKALHEELTYEPSGQQRFGPRLKYALLRTVVTRKTTTGKKTAAMGEIGGVVGSAAVSRLWQPVRLRTVASGASSAGISLGVDAGFNVTREFWPEIRHPHRRVKPAQTPGRVATRTAQNTSHLSGAGLHAGRSAEPFRPSPQK